MRTGWAISYYLCSKKPYFLALGMVIEVNRLATKPKPSTESKHLIDGINIELLITRPGPLGRLRLGDAVRTVDACTQNT